LYEAWEKLTEMAAKGELNICDMPPRELIEFVGEGEICNATYNKFTKEVTAIQKCDPFHRCDVFVQYPGGYQGTCVKVEQGSDCEVSAWSSWSSCSCNEQCCNGWKTRSRKMAVPPQLYGNRCPKMREQRRCNTGNCKERTTQRLLSTPEAYPDFVDKNKVPKSNTYDCCAKSGIRNVCMGACNCKDLEVLRRTIGRNPCFEDIEMIEDCCRENVTEKYPARRNEQTTETQPPEKEDCLAYDSVHDEYKCIFPFQYKGRVWNYCTDYDSHDNNRRWCSTKVDDQGLHIPGHFGHCQKNCNRYDAIVANQTAKATKN